MEFAGVHIGDNHPRAAVDAQPLGGHVSDRSRANHKPRVANPDPQLANPVKRDSRRLGAGGMQQFHALWKREQIRRRNAQEFLHRPVPP